MSTFFTWSNLATLAGATAATAYIVQFLKKFSAFSKLNTQAVSYGVGLVILFLATYFTGNLNASTGVMLFFNAVIVAFSSNGAYDSVKSTIAAVASAVSSSGSTSQGSNASANDTATEATADDKSTTNTSKSSATSAEASVTASTVTTTTTESK